MAAKTAAEKMRLKPGMTAAILHAPPGVVEALGLPADASVVEQCERVDFILTFAATQAEAEERVQEIAVHVRPETVAWIAYPKGGKVAGRDVSRDTVWAFVRTTGLNLVANVAVDDVWSALRLKPASSGPARARGSSPPRARGDVTSQQELRRGRLSPPPPHPLQLSLGLQPDRRRGVDATPAVRGVEPGRAEVESRALQPQLGLERRPCAVAAGGRRVQHEGHGAGDVRRRHRGAAHRRAAAVLRRREDAHARRRNIHLGAAAAERGDDVARSRSPRRRSRPSNAAG